MASADLSIPGFAMADIVRTYPGAAAVKSETVKRFCPDGGALISFYDYVRMLREIALACRDETLGLGIRALGIGSNHLIFRDLVWGGSVFEGMLNLSRNYNLLSGDHSNSVHPTSREIVYAVDRSAVKPNLCSGESIHLAMETFILGIHFSLSELFCDDLTDHVLCIYTMRRPAERFGTQAMSLLGKTVRYGSDFYGVSYRKKNLTLARPFQFCHPHEAYVRQVERKIFAIADEGQFSGEAASLATLSCHSHQKVLAAKLGVSPATLRRRMAERGASFRDEKRAVRNATAKKLLQTGLPTAAVAAKVGYCDEKSFSRAFRNWNGVTPASFVNGKLPGAD